MTVKLEIYFAEFGAFASSAQANTELHNLFSNFPRKTPMLY